MLRDDRPPTPDDIKRVRDAGNDWFRNQKMRNKNYSLAYFSEALGAIKGGRMVGRSVLSQFLKGTYKGDVETIARRVDDFLADQAMREGRFDARGFASIGLAEKVFGVIKAAKRNNSMGVVIMEPGDGKSTIARAYCAEDSGAVLVRVAERSGDAHGVINLLYKAMELREDRTFRAKRAAIEKRTLRNRSLIVLVDEAQKLKPSGLEVIRDLHDASDPTGEFCVPFVFFGDHDFYGLIVRSRNGEPSPIKPQMTRRMYPVFDSRVNAGSRQDPGQLYSLPDLVRILKNRQLRLLTSGAVAWLTVLANVRGWGSLGFAMAVVRMAYDIKRRDQVDVPDLQAALRMAIGPNGAKEIDQQAEGLLFKAVSAA